MIFPQGDRWLYDWQVVNILSVPVSPSIVLVAMDENGPEACGFGKWKTTPLARTISALSRAHAEVIAPALNVEAPTSAECGGLIGYTKLLEATKQAGNVVYPSTVPEALKKEAKEIGFLELTSDEDGIFRRVHPTSIAPKATSFPFGVAIAWASSKIWSPFPWSDDDAWFPVVPHAQTDGLVPFIGTWDNHPFPTYAFSTVWELIQQRKDEQLAKIVNGKAVILIPAGNATMTLQTPLEPAAPLGFVHATVLNSHLYSSWLSTVPHKQMILGALLTAILIALSLFVVQGRGTWLFVGVLIITFVAPQLHRLYVFGLVFPLLASTFAFVFTIGGTSIWVRRQERIQASDQIRTAGEQLTIMQETLARKELVVEQLEEELLEAKEDAQNTSAKYVNLSMSEDETRQQLQDAEDDAENTRQQLESLQHELTQLRKVSPALPQDTPRPSDSDQQKLQLEAEEFGILTCSPVLLKTFQELKKAATTNNPILILGETGTGKELFAHAAHRLSNRSHSPFVSVNMAAIRPELFESELFGHVRGAFTGAINRRGFLETADRGSVFLDEIGEMPLDLQAKLLRMLENGTFYRVGQSTPTHVDVRIIAATNRDLGQAVNDGQYREDLYYRLRSFVFRLPPLRERGEKDLALLVQHIVSDLPHNNTQKPLQVSQEAMEAIHAYAWPGNVRELRQTFAQAVALAEGDVLTERDLRLSKNEGEGAGLVPRPPNVETKSMSSKEEMARREDAFVLSTLRQYGFDMQATAKALEWDRSTVTQHLKGLGFQALVDHTGDVHGAAVALAGNPSHEKIVELKLDEYYRNLLSSTTSYKTAEQAIAHCRIRLRNIPERHFPAIETLIRQHYTNSHS